jgi:hypothetical protein
MAGVNLFRRQAGDLPAERFHYATLFQEVWTSNSPLFPEKKGGTIPEVFV